MCRRRVPPPRLGTPGADGSRWQVLEVFLLITSGGRDISYLEAHVAQFLLDMVSACLAAGCLNKFLALLDCVLSVNGLLLDPVGFSGLIACVCHVCNVSFVPEDVGGCLGVLCTVARAGVIPLALLPDVVATACRTAVLPDFNAQSVQLVAAICSMRGRAARLVMGTLQEQLEDPSNALSINLLQGLVFMLAQVAWGDIATASETFHIEAVLPSFAAAVKFEHISVTLELARACRDLIQRVGATLSPVAWTLLITVLSLADEQTRARIHPELSDELHGAFDVMEGLVARNEFAGDEDELFRLIEQQPRGLNYDMGRALQFRAAQTKPSTAGWAQSVDRLVDVYFRLQSPPDIRLQVLDILGALLEETKGIYDGILRGPVLRCLRCLPQEPDLGVLRAGIALVVRLASHHTASVACHTAPRAALPLAR